MKRDAFSLEGVAMTPLATLMGQSGAAIGTVVPKAEAPAMTANNPAPAIDMGIGGMK